MTELTHTFAKLLRDGTIDRLQGDNEAIAREIYGRIQKRVSPNVVPAFIDKARTSTEYKKSVRTSTRVQRRKTSHESAAMFESAVRYLAYKLAHQMKQAGVQKAYMNARDIQRKYFADDPNLNPDIVPTVSFGRLLAELTRRQDEPSIRVELGKGRPVKYRVSVK